MPDCPIAAAAEVAASVEVVHVTGAAMTDYASSSCLFAETN
jgi:hypothetical protein